MLARMDFKNLTNYFVSIYRHVQIPFTSNEYSEALSTSTHICSFSPVSLEFLSSAFEEDAKLQECHLLTKQSWPR